MSPADIRFASLSLWHGVRALALTAAGLAFASGLAAQSTFTVNTTDDTDDGTCDAVHCSLREAIAAGNHAAGASVIGFNIPGAGPHTILPSLSMKS
jgi:CSLREA domain-containing protein